MNRTIFALLLAALMFPSLSRADNWAHWRGPLGNGVSPTAKPPLRWSDTENVKWKVAIPGRGSGTPVVWENQVFVVTSVPAEGQATQPARSAEPRPAPQPQTRPNRKRPSGRRGGGSGGGGGTAGQLPQLAFKILCFDRATGQLLWDRTATVATPHQGMHATNTLRIRIALHRWRTRLRSLRFSRTLLLHDGRRTEMETRRFRANGHSKQFRRRKLADTRRRQDSGALGSRRAVVSVRTRQIDRRDHLEDRTRRTDVAGQLRWSSSTTGRNRSS